MAGPSLPASASTLGPTQLLGRSISNPRNFRCQGVPRSRALSRAWGEGTESASQALESHRSLLGTTSQADNGTPFLLRGLNLPSCADSPTPPIPAVKTE